MITQLIPLAYAWMLALTWAVLDFYAIAKRWLSDRFQEDEETLDVD